MLCVLYCQSRIVSSKYYTNFSSLVYVLSYLGMVCLSIATSRHPEHAVPFHPHYCTVSHLKAASQHIVIPDLLYHAKHPLAARDTLALVLCIIYEPRVVRSLCILAGSAHVRVWPKSHCSRTKLCLSEN